MNGANVHAEFSKEGLGGVRVNEIRLRVKLIYTLYTYKLTTKTSLNTKLKCIRDDINFAIVNFH